MANGGPGAAQRAASKFIIFENFKKLNTAEVRQGLSEAELYFVENLLPQADNNWTTVPGPNPAFLTINQTANLLFYGALNLQPGNPLAVNPAVGGLNDFCVMFTTAGSAWAINIGNGASVKFAPDGTFSLAPDMAPWENQRFLFNDSIAGYCSWDGSTFSRQGGVSTDIVITNPGSGYTSAPSVTITGGTGSGATAVATITPPGVSQVILSLPNFGGAGYLTAPTVIFVPPGASAVATIDPRGIISVTPGASGKYSPISALGPPPSVVVNLSGGGGSLASVTAQMAVDSQGFSYVQSYSFVAGSGYTSAPTANITPGPNTTQIIQATCTIRVGIGNVTGIAVTTPGSYSTAPVVSFSGGSPSTTASATAVLGGGGVATITLTNPGSGYLAGDTLFVNFAGGGGSGAAASAHVSPTVPKGTSVAVFQGRVWLNFFTGSNGTGPLNGLQWSGTGSSTVAAWDDWNVAHASGALVLPDTDLIHQITGLRAFNNFLWIIGDQSIKQIGNISLNQAGNVTLFTILTISSDQGTTYLPSCVSFNRVFFFLNQNGVYGVFGSSVQKISGDLDGIFQAVVFPPSLPPPPGYVVPQASLVDMLNVHHVMWLLKWVDNYWTDSIRSIFIIFNGQRWFVGSQGDANDIIAVTGTCKLNAPSWLPVAATGGALAGIFTNLSAPVNARLGTAMTHHQNPVQRKKTVRLGYAFTSDNPATMNISPRTDEIAEGTRAFAVNLAAGFQTRTVADPNVSGTYLGFDVYGLIAGFSISNLRIEYQETNIGNQL